MFTLTSGIFWDCELWGGRWGGEELNTPKVYNPSNREPPLGVTTAH